jgi:hypothetical protein
MDTLHDRLAELAEDAPTGGVPAAELWARGKRAHRVRVAGMAAAVLVVGAVGTGIGVGLADRDHSDPAPAEPVGIALPIEYPAGEQLPSLGDTPGPLAAIWLTPGVGGGALDAVGLVAGTGTFGTLPIDVSRTYMDPDAYFALSPDGRRIAYHTPAEELVVRDLVSGESYSPAFDSFRPRPADDGSYTWVDSTHLVGHVAPEADPASIHVGGEGDGWVWEPGTEPKLVNLMTYPGSPYLGPHAGVYEHPWFLTLPRQEDPRECLSLRDEGAGKTVPVLCDVVGVIGSEIALTHDGTGAVVALDIKGVENPALRQVVATAGAPLRVTFATDLIGQSLNTEGGAS